MERLNLNLLRALVVLLESRNVTQAANRLHLTQSAMSRQLGQLRDFFNDALLIREGNDYLLSARAQVLLPKVQRILADVGSLSDSEGFDPSSCQRRFRFACTDYVAQFIFPEVLQRLQQQAPGVDIIYQVLQSQDLEQLGQLPLDFISTMIPAVPENLHGIALGQDRSVCLMAEDHPLAQKQDLNLAELLDYPFVHINSGGDKDSFFDRTLSQQGLSRRILFEVPFFSAAFQVVSDSQALLILPEHIAHNARRFFSVTYCNLPMVSPENHYHFCWHGVHHQDPAHQWVRLCIAEQIRQSIFSPQAMDK
ncbi:LysR family transcriptional regulator [Oceanospirillum beijerinckii]|uniref:LysR family transcriptional regulator n=1 Tax=Oceanospirillum beijerinckii TaxID=64976 RepID=UPI00048406D7|nr:LysR family transcriptional regulator [Oceanospirillum beijerinckii]